MQKVIINPAEEGVIPVYKLNHGDIIAYFEENRDVYLLKSILMNGEYKYLFIPLIRRSSVDDFYNSHQVAVEKKVREGKDVKRFSTEKEFLQAIAEFFLTSGKTT